ncbi:hypothetical protein NT6N_12300 [Oceaniferula spumae]|uniref:Protein kinase domain-containing protein n=1 Tax=Oceaniferula spumae TaxID=2979115 RepID=A0AAT9FJK6_9BACT
MTLKQPVNSSPTAEDIQSYLPAYDRLELLAVGGMGAVYKARQISLDRPVAIKVLTHACSTALQFRQIFKCEAQVMAKLNHPNLVSIYDYGEANGLLYIVMQFVEGRSLHDAAHGKSVAPQESAALVSKISKALSHAHNAGILHRDIKPANILVDSKINPVVVDFGLAHHSHESTMKGQTVFGTAGYTAPEVLEPPYSADQRADIFSLGVLLHELLTGQMPQSPYVAPSGLAAVDPRYDAVVMRAIHPNPAKRYNNCEAFAADLDRIVAGKELSLSPLLLTPAVHPGLVHKTPVTSTAVVKPAATPQIPAAAPSEPSNVIALPSLDNSRKTNTSTKVALAACVTMGLVVSGLIVDSVMNAPTRNARNEAKQGKPKSPVKATSDARNNRGEPTMGPDITASNL